MATSYADLGVAAGINLLIMLGFLVAYTIFAKQPINARVYFTKWFIVDKKNAERNLEKLDESGNETSRPILELDPSSYMSSANWLKDTLFMPQLEFMRHVGLDGLVFLRLYLLGLKIFAPIAFLGFAVLVPLNATDNFLDQLISENSADYGEIDKLSMSNINERSDKLWAHVILAYVFTFWACYNLHKEYKEIARMRLDFLADLQKQPDQFTVLVRQVPYSDFESISRHVDHFFYVNHPDYYAFNQVVYNANKLASMERKKNKIMNKLTALHIRIEKYPSKPKPSHKIGFCGCFGARVDSVEFYDQVLTKLNTEIESERRRLLSSPSSSLMPSAFATFRKRWGAAVAAQTQQCRDNSRWITEWAPEPRDVYWANLAIPYLQLSVRQLAIMGALALFVVFFLFPVGLVQSLANLDSLEKKLPWLEGLINVPFINSFLQGFLPGLALKLFLSIVPFVCIVLSRIEGWISHSGIERKAMGKYYLVLLVNVFGASVITGTIANQVKALIESPTDIPTTFGNAIPTKALFFITLVMVDGWSSLTAELFRLVPIIIYHFYGLLLVRTPRDREKAMNVQGVPLVENVPQALFYFLIGFVYCVITPLLLPFLLVFFAIGYTVHRHQLINVYHAQYESAASYWPSVHGRIISAMIIHHVVLLGIFIIKKATLSGPFLVPLPILTLIWHYVFCKVPFENAFKVFSLEEAMKKDTIDTATDDLEATDRAFLHQAYLHPAVQRAMETENDEEIALWRKKTGLDGPKLVALKRYPHGAAGPPSDADDDVRQISRTPSESTAGTMTPSRPLLKSGGRELD